MSIQAISSLCTVEGTLCDEIKVGTAFSQNVVYDCNPHGSIGLTHTIQISWLHEVI